MSSRRFDLVFRELSRTIELLASHSDEEWCGSITFPRGFFLRESIETLHCGLGIRRAAIPGELVRIDFNIVELSMFPFKDLLVSSARLTIDPFFVGIGNVVLQETPEGFVVILADNRHIEDRHGEGPVVENRISNKLP
jgi:hypothetical protein